MNFNLAITSTSTRTSKMEEFLITQGHFWLGVGIYLTQKAGVFFFKLWKEIKAKPKDTEAREVQQKSLEMLSEMNEKLAAMHSDMSARLDNQDKKLDLFDKRLTRLENPSAEKKTSSKKSS